jgi:hypothetical protein
VASASARSDPFDPSTPTTILLDIRFLPSLEPWR